MKILGVIPARFASTRFPGKPLIDIGGKSMIRRVYEQAKKSTLLTEVVVATDDQRIANEVISFGGNFVLTAETHESGTDRCAEVANIHADFDVIINVQGDEPFIDPRQIDLLAELFTGETQIATLVKPLDEDEEIDNPNLPKVVRDVAGNALYFSRSAVPFIRKHARADWLQHHRFYRHIGLYGYTYKVLKELTKLPVGLLEQAEQLEQLRWLENGYTIKTAITNFDTIAVDVPDDLIKIQERYL